MKHSLVKHLDWISVILYLLLVCCGWIAIFSTTYSDLNVTSIFDINQFYGKQLLFIGLSFLLIIFILAVDSKVYTNFSVVFYLLAIALLAGLFIFGKETNGAKAWYAIGSITVQPSEFAKVATALAFARYVSDIHTDIRRTPDLLRAIAIISVPAILILLQPDVGSLLVFFSLVFVLFREGMPSALLFYLFLAAIVFIASLKFGTPLTLLACAISIGGYIFWHKKKTNRIPFQNTFILSALCLITALATHPVYDNVLKQHHRNRLNLWLRLETDPHKIAAMKRDFAYNTNMAESAITSGGIFGKGFLQGTRTKGSFIPEQHTDYIFTTIGEEWGFIGTSLVVILFSLLLLRLFALAERQKSKFNRVYGYCVISILFIHFCINIGMVISLIPTIGIPLPFFSYGGSGLWAFTILLFVFLRLDANKQ
nr:rod shape-determining protein RodA [uncultured Capnocytophaga sp.]